MIFFFFFFLFFTLYRLYVHYVTNPEYTQLDDYQMLSIKNMSICQGKELRI